MIVGSWVGAVAPGIMAVPVGETFCWQAARKKKIITRARKRFIMVILSDKREFGELMGHYC
jgi:hypothetical protein